MRVLLITGGKTDLEAEALIDLIQIESEVHIQWQSNTSQVQPGLRLKKVKEKGGKLGGWN